MKKIIRISAAALALVTVAVLLCSPIGAVQIKRLYGDIDNDGYVTTYDARQILCAAIGITVLDGYGNVAADIDCTGEIDLEDVRLALKMSAGIIETKYIENLEFDANPEEFVKELNTARLSSGTSPVRCSKVLSPLAQQAAKEFAEQTGTALRQADGSYYFKMLDEAGFSYKSADKIIYVGDAQYKKALDDMLKDSQSQKALCGKAYTTAGVGGYSPDGRTFYWCVLLIAEI